MLIICQPYSASTSLASSLAKILGVKTRHIWQDLGIKELKIREQNREKDFFYLPHSDMFVFDKEMIESMIKSKEVYKHHIIPSEKQIEILKTFDYKFVVVLRDFKSSYESAVRKIKENRTKDYYNIVTNKEISLKQFKRYEEDYRNYCGNDENFLLVNFEDLIKQQSLYMNKILSFYKIDKKVGENFKLNKNSYSKDRKGGLVK